MRKFVTAAVLVGAAGVCAAFAADPAPPAAAKPARVVWEYKVIRARELIAEGGRFPSLSNGLNKSGADGWELVGFEPAAAPAPGPTIRTPNPNPPTPEQVWEVMARGKDKDSVDLRAEQYASFRVSLEKSGQTIPADGILTKEVYIDYLKERRAVADSAKAGATYYFKRPKG